MASPSPSWRHIGASLRCVRQKGPASILPNGVPSRPLSLTATAHDQVQAEATTSTPQPPPSAPASSEQPPTRFSAETMKQWGELDPERVPDKRDERRLLRRDGLLPIGSRRRRATLARTATQKTTEIPFEQLPYQAFQEARKFLLQDRNEKLKQIETQKSRIRNLVAQDPAVSGGNASKQTRMRSMQDHLDELVILADINDPVVKKKFEDGHGDMNKPIYRHLADNKWRKWKRLVLEQRLTQMNVVPDLLPAIDLKVDIDLAFGRKEVAPGEFVDSKISEQMPRLTVQSFERGEKLVSVVVVDADVPVPEKDGFTYRCHFIASNIPISPTQTSIPLIKIGQADNKAQDKSAKKIAVPWLSPWAHKGAPYHRLAVFVLEQSERLDVTKIEKTKRDDFILRRFIDQHNVQPIGATLFRTQWDDSMPGVLERAGLADQLNIEFKRRRVEPLPYKRRTERMR